MQGPRGSSSKEPRKDGKPTYLYDTDPVTVSAPSSPVSEGPRRPGQRSPAPGVSPRPETAATRTPNRKAWRGGELTRLASAGVEDGAARIRSSIHARLGPDGAREAPRRSSRPCHLHPPLGPHVGNTRDGGSLDPLGNDTGSPQWVLTRVQGPRSASRVGVGLQGGILDPKGSTV